MTGFCPHYPPPHANKIPAWRAFWGARRSWMDTLYERSYAMQMGEVSLLTSKLFMVNDPACVRHVMQDAVAQYPKHSLLHEALKPLLGESIFTTNGAQWQRQRQMMNPSFAQARIDVAFTHMQGAAQAMQARMLSWDLNQAHDVQEEMTLVAADIIFRTIFSQGIEEGSARQVIAEFTHYQEMAPKLMLPAVYGISWLTAWRYRRRFNAAAATIRKLLLDMIRPRMATHAQRVAAPGYVPQDILDSLMDARDETSGQSFDEQELLDQVAMLFLAGHETSASAMAWSLHLLSHSPDIQERMRSELALATAGQPLQADQLRELALTWSVFREALRLFPPVGFIARSVTQTDEMRGKHIKPGDSVVIAPWLIHRHRELWDEPDVFKPDRFMDSDTGQSRNASRDAYLPFGAGPRVCIGANFAMQEAALVLSQLVKDFDILPCTGHVPQPVGRLTIRSDNGIFVRLRSRAKSSEISL
ncbi:cytochrome P450 [Variovorax sp. PCZ-1]|uniref:cytochrome P450 n=1 Tax=Variovorax sp. PCZ-1 TaxID=2835533 RepID=UPI001BD023B2|nr:cytochrome P450 [Variovorax sp. PCZ-1]MBS7807661.1 cytochrome P450 [Variovorax sp. PCZ-1]